MIICGPVENWSNAYKYASGNVQAKERAERERERFCVYVPSCLPMNSLLRSQPLPGSVCAVYSARFVAIKLRRVRSGEWASERENIQRRLIPSCCRLWLCTQSRHTECTRPEPTNSCWCWANSNRRGVLAERTLTNWLRFRRYPSKSLAAIFEPLMHLCSEGRLFPW